MSNLTTTAIEIISQLQQLLREQYRGDDGGLTILKEIVQNADDSGASRLHFVVLRSGIKGATNPLLRGPALVCVNDGSFTAENERAIRRMAGTSKAENPASVGRFGVGQKSVFHLVEAYFYLGRSPEAAKPLADVINPWSEDQTSEEQEADPSYRAWDKFDGADQDRVLDAVKQWTPGESWFVLYLPLRLPAHEREAAGVIYPHYPDVDKLEAGLEGMVELGYLLPQLGHLREINAWRDDGRGQTQLLGRASRGDQGRGLSRPGDANPPQSSFEVDVEIVGVGGEITRLHATGEERCVPDVQLSRLQSNKAWPQ
ncbi:MAG: sacsin N-terminal ATP-binding-like domain-containing protein, partial [Byssovorax sp.]